MVDESTQHRLDAAWEAAKHEVNDTMTSSSPQLDNKIDDDDDHHSTPPPSPLTSSLEYDVSAPPLFQLNGSDITNTTTTQYEDPFLLPSNETSPTSLASSSSTSLLTQPNNNNSNQLQMISSSTQPTVLTRYRTFLQRHSSLFSLIEMIMHRFIFYSHLFKSHHHDDDNEETEERGILRMEMYYAAWNVIQWINDVILVGVGTGMGLTLGSRGEWLDSSGSCNNNGTGNSSSNVISLNQWIVSRLETIIPIIRGTLTATTCIYPAVEAFSRRSIRTINHHQNIENDWDRRRHRAAVASYRLERVRFMGRMCLLVISWWARVQRQRQQQRQQQHQHWKEDDNVVLPVLLQRGGELDPYEELVSLNDAEDEAKVVQYVGRRTGRRSISTTATTLPPPSLLNQKGIVYETLSKNVPLITKATNLIQWISNRLTSSANKIVYVYAVGELLHILRPLYWSRVQCHEWQRRKIPLHQQHQQQQQRGRVSNSWSIWKAWWVSLFMDLISDQLLRLTNSLGGGGGDVATNNSRQSIRRGSSFMGRRGTKQSSGQPQHYQPYPSSCPSSAEEAKLAELEWRRSRHSLYLLRSPMYDVVTRPLASFIARVVSMIPSMGLGRWAAEYVLDMMSYWNDNHFMLES